MSKKEFIVKGQTLTSMVKWLNSEENTSFKKSSGVFTIGDVQNYIKRGAMPKHMGENVVERDQQMINVKIYNIVK